MANADVLYHAFNVGVIDKDKMHRVDLDRLRLGAEQQTNFQVNAAGRMFLRPGLGYLAPTNGSKPAKLLPFVAGLDSSYLLEFTDFAMRIFQNDAPVARQASTANVPNGDFLSGSTQWTLNTAAGQSTVIDSYSFGGTLGVLRLIARAHGGHAWAWQRVDNWNFNEQAIRINVPRGPVTLRLGLTLHGSELLPNGVETQLKTGAHSIAFTAAVSGVAVPFYVEFASDDQREMQVTYAQIETAGPLVLPTDWPVASLGKMQFDQSEDVMFIALEGYPPRRVESRGAHSWSFVGYQPLDGPFLNNPTNGITLTPNSLEGGGLLTASAPFFTRAHMGALFRLDHNGQNINTYLAGQEQYTPAIRVEGINEPTETNDRLFQYNVLGSWTGIIRNMRSTEGEDSGFNQHRDKQSSTNVDITTNVANNNDDNQDNVVEWFKIGFQPGCYTSGEAQIQISYQGGGGYGIGRVNGYASPTVVGIEIIKPFWGITPTENWREGAWSDLRGWPTALCFHEGRLFLAGADSIWGSISDAYDSHDEEFVGDAGPISRSLAIGGRNYAHSMVSLTQLFVGADTMLARVTAGTLQDILTPSNLGVRSMGKPGAAQVRMAQLANDEALYPSNGGNALRLITVDENTGQFVAGELSKLSTELFQAGIKEMAVQSSPDQRAWIINNDGSVVCVTYVPEEKVVAFIPMETVAGETIESIAVLPGLEQDRLYAVVHRTLVGVNGIKTEVRYVEKMALDREAAPAAVSKTVDCFKVTGTVGSAIATGLDHLERRTVVGWADGAPLLNPDGTRWSGVVLNGQVTMPRVLAAGSAGAVLGLPYRARYKSGKLAYGDGNQTGAGKKKAIAGVSLLLADYVRSQLKYGEAFDDANNPLFNLPTLDQTGAPAADIVIGPGKDEPLASLGGEISNDARLCIEANSPFPAAVLQFVLSIAGYGS